ncbi:MAG: hypothetical protein AAF570_21115 [Bacteroidota bacterium]
MRRYSVFLLALLLIVGCKEDPPETPDRGRTFLHLLSGAEVDTFDVTFDYFNADDQVIKDFHWMRNFPISGYADMEAGGEPDEFDNGKLFMTITRQPFANLPADTVMMPMDLILERDQEATMCIVDSFGEITLLKFVDEYSTSPGMANVRFINLASGQPVAGLTTASGDLNISNVSFMEASAWTTVPAGVQMVELRDTSGTAVVSQNLWLNSSGVYTFYVSGSSPSLDHFIH